MSKVSTGDTVCGVKSTLGQRQTRQREMILQVLKETSGPLSVKQVFERAQNGNLSIGIATVYRTINLLLESQQIKSLILPTGETRYESASLGHHDHFQCRRCQNVFDLDTCPLHLARGTIIPGGYLVEDHEMTLYGLCPGCAKRRSAIKKVHAKSRGSAGNARRNIRTR